MFMKTIILLLTLILFSFVSNAQYNTIYENSFRNWQPGQGWVILDNDTSSVDAGLFIDGFFGGVPVPFYLEIFDYGLGLKKTSSTTDQIMFTPPLIIGSNTFMRYFSSFDLNQEISVWAVTNVNDTTLTSLTDSLRNSSWNGFNLIDLNAYAGDTIRIAFRIRGLISKAFIDNLLVLD